MSKYFTIDAITMKRFFTLIICCILYGNFSFSQTDLLFKDGDRVCFIGNSITNNGEFHTNVFLYYATRFPDQKIYFHNCGISGDNAGGLLARMDSDILVHKPTVAVVMIGMNDVSRRLYDKNNIGNAEIDQKKSEAIENYKKNTKQVAERLTQYGSRLVIQTPSIYDQTARIQTSNLFGVNDALFTCGEYLKSIAPTFNAIIVDYWSLMTRLNEEQQRKDSTYTLIGADRVHPASPGHLVMAYQFLRTTNSPEYVSNTVIDAKKKSVIDSYNAEVKLESVSKLALTFTMHEKALPFPVKKEATHALELVPFTQNLNKEILSVKGLSKGAYQLTIDDIAIGKFSAEDFAKGINLALYDTTPQYKQAQQIAELCDEYRGTYGNLRVLAYVEYKQMNDFAARNNYDSAMVYLNAKKETAGDYAKRAIERYQNIKPKETELIQKLTDIRDQIYTLNKPKLHSYKIVRSN